MNRKAIVLLSGGLDSTLVIRILQEQNIEIEAVNFRTAFGCCKDDALEMSRQFGVRVTMVSVTDDYFKMIEKPKYGWGKGINPCVDCRIYMFRLAKKFMEVSGASFVASGEVVGQRPMSQLMRQLRIIEAESGLTGLLLRPLSAKLLDPTIPEQLGIVDREKLYGISGRSRKELLDLAEKYGIENPPTPSNGCLLTEPDFAVKVRDLFKHTPDYERWHFETLKVGRHFRLSEDTKVILGRDQEENKRLEVLNQKGSVLFIPFNFIGPSALVTGVPDESSEQKACAMILRYTKSGREAAIPEFERIQNGVRGKITFSETLISDSDMVSLKI